MAVLTLLWGCSSDEDEKGGDLTFTESAKPTWRVDWFSTAAPPDWHDPASTAYECSMNRSTMVKSPSCSIPVAEAKKMVPRWSCATTVKS